MSPPGASMTLWSRSISVFPDCCGAITPVAFSSGNHRSVRLTRRLMQRDPDLRRLVPGGAGGGRGRAG